MVRLTTEEFIEQAIQVHGIHTYDYSKVEYVDAKTNVIIICPTHGEFLQTPNSHKTHGCSKCATEGHRKQYVSNKDKFVASAIKIHGENTYDYSKVEYKNARIGVIIICPMHGEFKQSPDSHLNKKNGCPKCSRLKYTTEDFIKIAKQIHGDTYNYSLVNYKGCNEKVKIICSKHGEFEQTQNQHIIAKHGCPTCGSHKPSNEEFIEKSNKIHGKDKYDYSKIQYVDNTTKILIGCKIHGYFEQSPDKHINAKHGCPECGGSRKSNKEEFIEKSNKIHGAGTYDYSKIEYVNNKSKIIINCPKHGDFEQRASDHTNHRCGCPKCAQVGFSKMQIQWLEFLEGYYNIHIRHIGNSAQEYNIRSTKWKADGYCKDTKTIYEFHGDYWHGNPRRYDPKFVNVFSNKTMETLYKNTMKREKRIKELGYNLIVMWELDWTIAIKLVIAIQRKFKSWHLN